jgi:hypothetical protein
MCRHYPYVLAPANTQLVNTAISDIGSVADFNTCTVLVADTHFATHYKAYLLRVLHADVPHIRQLSAYIIWGLVPEMQQLLVEGITDVNAQNVDAVASFASDLELTELVTRAMIHNNLYNAENKLL